MKSPESPSISRPLGGASGSILNPPPAPAALAINGFSPGDGTVGTLVNITGSGFTRVTSVKFNGVLATQYTIVSDTMINATVPTGATTGLIAVSDGSATAYSPNNFIVDPLAPEIDALQPGDGIAGDTVNIVGRRLASVTQVFFNKVPAQFRMPPAAQLIVATVPAGATTGPVRVVGSNGSATTAPNQFVVDVPPQPTGVNPPSGPAGTKADITGDHLDKVTSVTFGAAPAAKINVLGPHEVKATAPSIGAGQVLIKLTNRAGSGTIPFTVT